LQSEIWSLDRRKLLKASQNCFIATKYLVRAIVVGALHYFEVNLLHFLCCNLKHENIAAIIRIAYIDKFQDIAPSKESKRYEQKPCQISSGSSQRPSYSSSCNKDALVVSIDLRKS